MAPGAQARGVRFKEHRRYKRLAELTHRTFSDMVEHLCALGYQVMMQDDRDARLGERIRRRAQARKKTRT